MGFTLFALFFEIDTKLHFYKYFWDGEMAFTIGESKKQFMGKKITGYNIEQHKVSNSFEHNNLDSYFSLANNYEFV